jgi:hypothetical protein
MVRCDGDRLRFGSLTLGCEWQPVSDALLELPAVPDWVETLSVKYQASRGRILAGGYQVEIRKAERKLAMLTARIAKSLAPLGVTEQDIRALIEDRMARRFAGGR